MLRDLQNFTCEKYTRKNMLEAVPLMFDENREHIGIVYETWSMFTSIYWDISCSSCTKICL